jgi:hypothetical protein
MSTGESRFEIDNINASVYLQDDTDLAKRVQFDVTGVTTGNDRIITVLDENITMVGESNTQTLTNKNIDADNNTVTNIADANIKSGAAIDATKIADGSISNTEFQYLNGTTSNIQTQITTHVTDTNNPHSVTKAQVGLSNVENTLNKFDATTDPGIGDDDGDGYSIGSTWINTTTGEIFVATDVSTGAAVWKSIQEEANTASNVGTAGVGVFKQKTGVDLEFKNINAGSTKITVADDTGNNEIDVDIDVAVLEPEINILNLNGAPDEVGTAVVGTTDVQTLTNKTLTNPKIDTALLDTNGNELMNVTATASAVNEVTLANAATGTAPSITASGDDTNIDLNLQPKGTGQLVLDDLKWPASDGSADQVLKTDGAGNIGFANVDILNIATTTTTDDTDTEIVAIATSNDTAYFIESNILGIRTDTGNEASEAVAYKYTSFFRNDAGTLNKVNEQRTVLEDSSARQARVTTLVSGTDISIQVRGITSRDFKWKITYKVTTITVA